MWVLKLYAFLSFLLLCLGHNLSLYPNFDVPTPSPAQVRLKDSAEDCVVGRKLPSRGELVLSSTEPPRMDPEGQAARCPKADGSAPAPGPLDACSESQVYLTIGESQNPAGPDDEGPAGQASDTGLRSLAEEELARQALGLEEGQGPALTYLDVKSCSEAPCTVEPTGALSAQPGRGCCRGNRELEGSPLRKGASGGSRPNAPSSEQTALDELRALGQGADREGKVVLPSLRLLPSEPGDPPDSARTDSLDVGAPPKDPHARAREDVSVLLGLIKRSSSIISDSGIESEPSSAAWSEARNRTLGVPSDREASHLLVRGHALHQSSLEAGHTDSNTSLPSGTQASLTSISSLPFEDEERELALTTLTKSASAPHISSPEESAEGADSTWGARGPADAPAVPVRGRDPPGRGMRLRGGSGIQDAAVARPPAGVVPDADTQQGPGYMDIPKADQSPSDPQGPRRPDGRTENPLGIETKGLRVNRPHVVAAPENPRDRPFPGALVGTPEGMSGGPDVGKAAPSNSGTADAVESATDKVPGPHRPSAAGAPDPAAAGRGGSTPGTTDVLEPGHEAGAGCPTGTRSVHSPLWGGPAPGAGPSLTASPLSPAEAFAVESLKHVEIVNLSVSCTTTCFPFSSAPTETPARPGFFSKQTAVPITHQPLGSFEVVSSRSSALEEAVSGRMLR